MYGVVRNIKMNPQVVKPKTECKTSTYIVGKSPRKFKSKGYGKFTYPTYDKVPSGDYFSKIISAEDSTTSNGNYAIEFCCEVRSIHDCYKIANGLMSENDTDGVFYIRTKLSEKSPYYQIFVDSMSEALDKGDEEFEAKDLQGITEHITLAYNGEYANYIKRIPYEFEWYKEDLKVNDDEDLE